MAHLSPPASSSTSNSTGTRSRGPSLRRHISSSSLSSGQQADLADAFDTSREKRARSSSILSVHEIQENYDDTADQGAFHNLQADWVNYKGAWSIHVVLLIIGKLLVDSIPHMEQDTAWTLVLQSYCLITYLLFHAATGTHITNDSSNAGVFDKLTLWEQIDGGAQYTPAKKWLTSVPVILFLLSTHYTRYDHHPIFFTLNLLSTVILGLIPKLPVLHRLRFRLFDGLSSNGQAGDRSGANTPISIQMARPALHVKGLDRISEH